MQDTRLHNDCDGGACCACAEDQNLSRERLTLFEHHAIEAMRCKQALVEDPDSATHAAALAFHEAMADRHREDTTDG